jgi:hypothetical protein
VVLWRTTDYELLGLSPPLPDEEDDESVEAGRSFGFWDFKQINNQTYMTVKWYINLSNYIYTYTVLANETAHLGLACVWVLRC